LYSTHQMRTRSRLFCKRFLRIKALNAWPNPLVAHNFGVVVAVVFSLLALAPAIAAEPTATGTFAKGFSTTGSVKIHKENDQWLITFGKDFVHEGSPDPWVAVGKNGFQRAGIVGELKQFKGSHSFVIERLDPTEFNEVYIWCVLHNANLGRAKVVWE